MNKIPCTVAVLTFNSGGTLDRALESVRDFAEIIICDGGSTDNTLQIAKKYNARVLPQDARFKDSLGRIIDFAGVRNQTLHAATHDWFFFLDSDEVLTSTLVNEIREIAAGAAPATYWVDRKYEIEGKVVACAATYPTRQMRFFHTQAVTEFIKPIHERINPKPEAVIKITKNFMLIPVSRDPRVWREKWKHYIELEVARRGKISFAEWLSVCFENLKISTLYAIRYTFNAFFCSGPRMPFALEWERHVYHWNLCRSLLGNLMHRSNRQKNG